MSSYSLTSWAKAHLSALYESPANAGEEDFQESFDLTFAQNVQIVSNHTLITRDELKQDIRDMNVAATAVSTEWKDVVELETQGSKEGIVTGSFIVTRFLKFRIRAAAAQTSAFVSFSAKIEQESQDQDRDNRRIIHLLLTCIDKTAPIHLQSVPIA